LQWPRPKHLRGLHKRNAGCLPTKQWYKGRRRIGFHQRDLLGLTNWSWLCSQRWCHDFHLFTHYFLSLKRPNTRSNHDMALSYLILSYLFFFTLQSHTKKTRKADSIGIPIQDYLLIDQNSNPLILLVGVPIPILLHISLVPTMRPGPVKR